MLRDYVHAESGELVLEPADRALVPRDDARRKDHRVAFLEHDLRVVVVGDARQGRTRLALAAGANQQHLVARQESGLLVGEERRHALKITGLARGMLDPPQRPSDQRYVPVVRRRRRRRGGEARDIRGEACDHRPLLAPADQIDQRLPYIGLGA